VASDEAVRLPHVLPGASAEPAYRFLSPHQAAVLDAATRRLIPGPEGHQSQPASLTSMLFGHIAEAMYLST
jgi:hypothetical protein